MSRAKAEAAFALSDEDLHEHFDDRGFLGPLELEEVAGYNKVGNSWDALLALLRERLDRGELSSVDYEFECVDIESLRALEKKLRHTLEYDFVTGALHSAHYDEEPPCRCGVITKSDQKYLDSKSRATAESDDEEYDNDGEGEEQGEVGNDDAATVKIPRLTPDVRNRIRALLEEGVPVREIAREIGAAKGTISYWKRKLGL